MVVATQRQTDQVKQTPFVTKEVSFDTDVLEPLRAIQIEQANKLAQEEAERVRQAQIALEQDLNNTASKLQPQGTYANNYTALNCTWYVAGRIQVPNSMGNATNWSYGLRSAGWREGDPRRGAVGVSHNGYAGHVVVAERVENGQVLISEYNWVPYSYTERWVSFGEYEWFFQ